MKIEDVKHIAETCQATECDDCIGECVYEMDRNKANRDFYKQTVVAALEKQIPAEITKETAAFVCPRCRRIIKSVDSYCWNCGQALKWD